VLSVIFGHAHFSWFSGGFAGVDIFYVISGFLITQILKTEVEEQRFSIVRFYERRARRILPALFLVTLVSIPLAWHLMLPGEFRDFGQSLVAVNLFLSNVFFMREVGYFDPYGDFKPLLHTWSLAVEEQFYLLFPVLFLLIYRYARRWAGLLLIVLALASLAVAEIGAFHNSSANFYLLQSRAWELLAGSLLALNLSRPAVAPTVLSQMLSLLGLAAIVASVLVFDLTTPWPAAATTVPVLGAVLVIAYARPRTLAHAILSTPILRGIGIISYSAYLWHQPVFAFYRIHRGESVEAGTYLLLILVTLGLSYLSWRFVEQPFRRPEIFDRRLIFVGSAAVLAAFVSLGGWIHLGDGLSWRLSPEANLVGEGARSRSPFRDQCTTLMPASFEGFCRFGQAKPRVVAVLGDSHSSEPFWQMAELLGDRPFSVQEFTWNTCLPFAGLRQNDTMAGCTAFFGEAQRYILAHAEIDTVVLIANWPNYFTCKGRYCAVVADARPDGSASGPGRMEAVTQHIGRQIDSYLQAGKTVVLVYPIPEMTWWVPHYLMAQLRRGTAFGEAHIAASEHAERSRAARAFLDGQAAKPGVYTVDPAQVLCGDPVSGVCRAEMGGVPLYFDSGHLNGHGAARLATLILARLDALPGGSVPRGQ
jgi:peptidoglycan/LPS O-acetylase OafA/YrhL